MWLCTKLFIRPPIRILCSICRGTDTPAVFHLQQQSLPAAGTGRLILLLGRMNPLHLPLLLFSVVLFYSTLFSKLQLFSLKINAWLSSVAVDKEPQNRRLMLFWRTRQRSCSVAHPAFLIVYEGVILSHSYVDYSHNSAQRLDDDFNTVSLHT